jgi:cellobiose phosphorylase
LAFLLSSAQAGTWTGKISDSMCGATHKKMEEHGSAKISDRDCTLACVKNGAQYVFVSQNKVYQITNQDYAGLQKNAGPEVKVTGELAGDNIKISDIQATGGKKQK